MKEWAFNLLPCKHLQRMHIVLNRKKLRNLGYDIHLPLLYPVLYEVTAIVSILTHIVCPVRSKRGWKVFWTKKSKLVWHNILDFTKHMRYPLSILAGFKQSLERKARGNKQQHDTEFYFGACDFMACYSLKNTLQNILMIHSQEKHEDAAIFLKVWKPWQICRDI